MEKCFGEGGKRKKNNNTEMANDFPQTQKNKPKKRVDGVEEIVGKRTHITLEYKETKYFCIFFFCLVSVRCEMVFYFDFYAIDNVCTWIYGNGNFIFSFL